MLYLRELDIEEKLEIFNADSMMTREELVTKVNSILSEEFEADIIDMQPDAPLMEVLDLDSLDIVDIVVLVEKNFGYVMKKEDFAEIRTFSDFYDFLYGKISEAETRQ